MDPTEVKLQKHSPSHSATCFYDTFELIFGFLSNQKNALDLKIQDDCFIPSCQPVDEFHLNISQHSNHRSSLFTQI